MTDSLKSEIPLIVITGPTASGKTGLALELAGQYGGEIICADSRTVYRGMDIGTAKPSLAEQKMVKHWLLDVADPGSLFTAADFKRLADIAIDDIRSRGRVPFLVGGSGLYIDAVVLNFSFAKKADPVLRKRLEQLSTEELHTMIKKQQLVIPANYNNRRHLIRCIEKNNTITSGKNIPMATTHLAAIKLDKTKLEANIIRRIDTMFADGVVQETQQLLQQYGPDNEALTGNIYRIIRDYLAGNIDKDTAKLQAIKRDRQLVKRQITWLKRHDYVAWLGPDEVRSWVGGIIEKYRDA